MPKLYRKRKHGALSEHKHSKRMWDCLQDLEVQGADDQAHRVCFASVGKGVDMNQVGSYDPLDAILRGSVGRRMPRAQPSLGAPRPAEAGESVLAIKAALVNGALAMKKRAPKRVPKKTSPVRNPKTGKLVKPGQFAPGADSTSYRRELPSKLGGKPRITRSKESIPGAKDWKQVAYNNVSISVPTGVAKTFAQGRLRQALPHQWTYGDLLSAPEGQYISKNRAEQTGVWRHTPLKNRETAKHYNEQVYKSIIAQIQWTDRAHKLYKRNHPLWKLAAWRASDAAEDVGFYADLRNELIPKTYRKRAWELSDEKEREARKSFVVTSNRVVLYDPPRVAIKFGLSDPVTVEGYNLLFGSPEEQFNPDADRIPDELEEDLNALVTDEEVAAEGVTLLDDEEDDEGEFED